MAVHLREAGGREQRHSETYYEYLHQTECGYVRTSVTYYREDVTCKLCLRKMKESKL